MKNWKIFSWSEIASINHQVSLLAYPEKNRKNFLIRVHSLHAMGWISLQQLKVVAAGKPLIRVKQERAGMRYG